MEFSGEDGVDTLHTTEDGIFFALFPRNGGRSPGGAKPRGGEAPGGRSPGGAEPRSPIEVLRGLRYVQYAAWIAKRWDDPSFTRTFPDWGTERYWEAQVADIHEQLAFYSREVEGFQQMSVF